VKASNWFAFVAVVFVGCGGSAPPTPANAEVGRAALIRGLDAWKAGERPDALKSGADPIYFMDFEWDRGAKLLDYSLESSDVSYGAERRYNGSFTLNVKGKNVSKRLAYLVGTNKPISVRREEE